MRQLLAAAVVMMACGCGLPGGLTRARVAELNMRGELEGAWTAPGAGGVPQRLSFRPDGTAVLPDGTVRAYRIDPAGHLHIAVPGGEGLELQFRREPPRLIEEGRVWRPARGALP